MGVGLQIWNSSGNLIFDTGDQVVKFMGSLIVGSGGLDTATGTITDTRFTAYAGHTPFYFRVETGSGSTIYDAPVWTFSGNNLNWSFPNPSSRPNSKIIYGIIGTI